MIHILLLVLQSELQKLLHKIADRIEDRAREIALVESYDSGQAIRFMSKAAIRGSENYRFFADKAPDAQNGLSLPTKDHINYTLRSPIGPVGVITPWNTPFMLSTWKIAPALAAGCTVVHKPAEWSPLTAMILAEISAGELIDKITILEIKKTKIVDQEKLKEVNKEHNSLINTMNNRV